jgi:beta-lactam-binding protein with PASTA domain
VRALALLFLLAGCPMVKSGSSTTPGGGGGGGGETAGGGGGGGDGKLAMPSVMGKTEAEARQIVAAAGMSGDVEVNSHALECENAAHDEGKINCQEPEPGRTVDKHSIINVSVYHKQTHEGRYIREDTEPLIGLSLDQVKKRLAQLGFKGQIDVKEMKEVTETVNCKYDTVCTIYPMEFQTDSQITIHVNKAKAEIKMPD